MKARLVIAALVATSLWAPLSMNVASGIYCYPGDPADVYQACKAYNAGIQQQVSNQRTLQNIQSQIHDAELQISALYVLLNQLDKQIKAQEALIAQTKAKIADIDRQIRFKQADLTRVQADVAIRDQLLGQRIRYEDSHGPINYVELVLTASTFNDLVNRMIAAQQIAASDRKLLNDLNFEHALMAQQQSDLSTQRAQVSALLLQQQAQRAAIDAHVAQLALQYDAAAAKAGGGTGTFEWPEPACNFSCISQGFGCSTFYLEVYDPNCPYPHKIHTGLDIAGPYGTNVVAADTGVMYLYPGSIGYGNMILMVNGHGYSTVYGHLARFAGGLRTGMIVARGTTIAFEGSTGWSTGPHLHFEIRVNNVYKDPCIWLGC